MIRWLLWLGLALAGVAHGEGRATVCYGYGCAYQIEVVFEEPRFSNALALLGQARDATSEQALLAEVLGQLYGWAGEQTPIKVDRRGNWADEGRRGSMDCIDHSTTTQRFLALLAAKGALRFHRPGPIVKRTHFLFFEHYAATVETLAEGQRFVVDSWFVDNGEAAIILPLEDWQAGAGPDV